MQKAVNALVIAVIAILLAAWGLMIIIGVAHHEWWQFIPTMSYKTALVLVAIKIGLGTIAGYLRPLLERNK